MSDETLTETAAEIAALIPRYSWEIMDEEQRDDLMAKVVLPRYMMTTADGIQTGPTFWAEMVGATAHAIRGRVQRLRQSQNETEDERARALSPSTERHVKSGLRKEPGLIAAMATELHDDPEYVAAIASASSQIDAKREQRQVDRRRVEKGLTEQEAEFERLRVDFRAGRYGEAERRLEQMEITEEISAFLRGWANRQEALIEWARGWADGQRVSDDALAEWLA